MTLAPSPTTTESCAVHKSHAPAPTYCEVHHWIPRAWQEFWTPPGAPPFPGSYAGQTLWDARTVPLCRTGHGNVHYWIVLMTKRYAACLRGVTHAESTPAQLATWARASLSGVGRADLAVAVQALVRFEAAGGDLGTLVAAKLWGEI